MNIELSLMQYSPARAGDRAVATLNTGNAADKAINLRAFILFFPSQGDRRDDFVVASKSLLKSAEFENASEVKEPIWMFGRMVHPQLVELTAFVAVAEQLSFTKAAVQVGSSLPTISQRIRSLEERLGVRLFNRTTRSVALTEAGERLFGEIKPIIEGLDHAIESVNFYRDKPIGALRLAVSRPAAIRQLAPLISPFLSEYPAIRLDVVVDDTDRDMVSGRFDAGIRVGRSIEQDMTILRLSDDPKMVVVAAPRYLESRPVPFVPKDLHAHNCIRFRWPWDGTMQPWIFRKGRENIEVRVEGSLTVNDVDLLLSATLDGIGISFMAESVVESHIAEGRLLAGRLEQLYSGHVPLLSKPAATAYAVAGLCRFR